VPAYLAACKGTPIPHAARYAGTLHPLVVVDRYSNGRWAVDTGPVYHFGVNVMWAQDRWDGPIQLVVCVDSAEVVKVGSCGTYTRKSDGEVGEIIRYRSTVKARVVVARTGRNLEYRTFAGSTPECSASLELPATGLPPWDLYGDDVTGEPINTYAWSVVEQKVK
jgi:hypothetical protein